MSITYKIIEELVVNFYFLNKETMVFNYFIIDFDVADLTNFNYCQV